MAFYDYPIIGSEKGLPLYLLNMGLQHCQDHILRPNGFPFPQILYCTKGSGTLVYDQKKILIPPYHAIFLPADLPHEYYPNEPVWDIHWVVFSGDASPAMLTHFNLLSLSVFKLRRTEKLESLFYSMHDALQADHIFGNYVASGILYEFLIEFYRNVSGLETPSASSGTLRKAIKYVDEHFRSQISLEMLCNTCGVSKQHLCLLFRTTLHTRPMEYVAKRKLQAAKELLTGTSMTVEEIAEEVGFCTASYFCKVFKHHEGITPKQFKQKSQPTKKEL